MRHNADCILSQFVLYRLQPIWVIVLGFAVVVDCGVAPRPQQLESEPLGGRLARVAVRPEPLGPVVDGGVDVAAAPGVQRRVVLARARAVERERRPVALGRDGPARVARALVDAWNDKRAAQK